MTLAPPAVVAAHVLPAIRRAYVAHSDGSVAVHRDVTHWAGVPVACVPNAPFADRRPVSLPPFPDTVTSVACAACGAVLCGTALRSRVLPSADWVEMVDCWSCHRGEFAGVAAAATVATSDPSIVLHASGTLAHRGLRIVVSLSDIARSAGGDGAPRDCLECACGAQVLTRTYARSESEGSTHGCLAAGSVLLHSGTPGCLWGSRECAADVCLALIACEIVQVAEAHGCLRFTLGEQRLSLVSWNTLYASGSERLAPALLFRVEGAEDVSARPAVLPYDLDAALSKDQAAIFAAAIKKGSAIAALFSLPDCSLVPLLQSV